MAETRCYSEWDQSTLTKGRCVTGLVWEYCVPLFTCSYISGVALIFCGILVCLKAGSTNNAEELALVTTDFQAGTNSGQQHNSPTDARIDPCYGYSFMDYFLKYFLIICNLLFTVLGLLLLALGVWGLISKESFAQEKISSIGTDPMLVVLSVGFLLTVLCLSGCVGALRENRCLLKLFSATVLVLITAQVIITIVAHTLQDQIEGNLRSGMLVAIARYQDDLDLRFITDEIQSNLQCCGADNYRDWEINMWATWKSFFFYFFESKSKPVGHDVGMCWRS